MTNSVQTQALVAPQLGKPNGKSHPAGKKGSAPIEPVQKTVDEQAAELFAELDGATADAGDKTPPPAEKSKEAFPATVDPTLIKILQWKRPHATAGEQNFVTWLHKEIERRGHKLEVTTAGNIVVMVPYPAVANATTPQPGKPVAPTNLFSCHTDTVHYECSGEQAIVYDPNFGHIFLDKKAPGAGSCLGADDGAGIWLMLEMLSAGVPGSYVFHRGEEKGGIGSYAMIGSNSAWLAQHDIAVAFDRKDTKDVVVEQGGMVCASDKFGEAFAKALNRDSGFEFKISRSGTFTDTKVYRRIIAECANISVGYENAHSQDEYLNYDFLVKLRAQLIAINWDMLPVDRDPAKQDPSYHSYGKAGKHDNYERWKDVYSDDGQFDRERAKLPPVPPMKPKGKGKDVEEPSAWASMVASSRASQEPPLLDELRSMTLDDLREMCESDPDACISVITAMHGELEAAYAKIETYRAYSQID